MSQRDYHKSRAILIDFDMREGFASLQAAERLTLTLITNGKALLDVNDSTLTLIAPCVFLSSWYDRIMLIESNKFAAKSFHFHPTFVNKNLTFENISNNDFDEIADEHDHHLLMPFLARNETYNGIINPLPQTYLQISEWFDLAEKETKMKSDGHWLYRVRRHLMQILFLLESTYADGSGSLSDDSIIDIVLEHIHANYSKEISLDALCKLVYVNRTTLTRKFKARTRRTPIDYLLHHRLNVACELLTHSILSISKIAETTGFKYENYFSRQFTAKIGMTPTQYRQSDGFETLNIEESRIVDEF